ncbi:PD40 domain-containing protein [Longispora albida]|uniref:PD40 domain-containing protein n=1 Tax=Longispora albida TaxID=203523 RepID=UPI00036F5347|nr:PD40 domain-containing protein [Longispora albida]
MNRKTAGILAITAVLVLGGGYVAWSAWRQSPASAAGGLDVTKRGSLLYVGADGRVAQRAQNGTTTTGDLRCLRVYSAGGTTSCMRTVAVPAGFETVVLGKSLEPLRTIRVDGTPSRTRVSASGRLVAWTVFRTGDSYQPGRFSTTAGIYDTQSKRLYGSLEDFALTIDGQPYDKPDVNYWGVTFAADDRTFYATVGSGDRTWLLRGDLATRSLTSVRENAECPSLSPDGTRVAYKKKDQDGQWRLTVLDLKAGTETPLAETMNIDDQQVWLDNATIGYGRPQNAGVYAVPADGSGAPTLVQARASSPSPL